MYYKLVSTIPKILQNKFYLGLPLDDDTSTLRACIAKTAVVPESSKGFKVLGLLGTSISSIMFLCRFRWLLCVGSIVRMNVRDKNIIAPSYNILTRIFLLSGAERLHWIRLPRHQNCTAAIVWRYEVGAMASFTIYNIVRLPWFHAIGSTAWTVK